VFNIAFILSFSSGFNILIGSEIKFRFKWPFTEEVITAYFNDVPLKAASLDELVPEKFLIMREACIVLLFPG